MIRRAWSLIALLAILAGVPVFLWHTTGSPGTEGLPDLEGLKRAIDLRWVPLQWAFAILALVAWMLWGYLALAVLVRISGHFERHFRGAGRMWAASEALAWSPVKVMVDVVLGAAFVTSTVTNGSAPAAASHQYSGWSTVIAPQVAAIRSQDAAISNGAVGHVQRDAESPKPPDRPRRGPHPRSVRTYVVRPGDSLWSIAEAKLDDPYRWVEIWKLNRDRDVGDNERLVKPGFIRPGWTLVLPGTETREDRDHTKKKRAGESVHKERSDRHSSRVALGKNGASPSSTHQSPPSHDQQDEKSLQRVELPSGTAVATGFVTGFLTALAFLELRARRRRATRSLARGWPSARISNGLKSGLIRALAAAPEEIESRSVDKLVKDATPKGTNLVLGHRNGTPVVTNQSGIIYTVTGDEQDVSRYLRELALHALVSHSSQVEIWSTGELGLDKVAGLSVFRSVRNLVSELEIEILKRHRLFDEEGTEAWDAHQEAWPDDPLPIVIGVSFSDDSLGSRLAAIATQGQDLGLLVFASSSEHPGVRIDGHVLHPLETTRDVLGNEPFDAIRFSEEDREEVLKRLTETPGVAGDESVQPIQLAPGPHPDAAAPIQVRLFGPPEISGVTEDAPDGFGPKSKEMLFFFLLHPQGVSREEAIEILWPETDPKQGVERFWFQLRTVRNHLRSDQAPTAKFIFRDDEIYRPAPELFDVDVWEFDRLIANAIESDNAIALLEQVSNLYRGDLLRGIYYAWADDLRSHFRNRYLDALVRLSELRSHEADFDGAINTLLRAVAVDPYAEHLYRRVMELYAHLGRAPDIHRTYRELEATLNEALDADPIQETEALKDRLLQHLDEGDRSTKT